MSTRRSARLRAKGRRRWADMENDDDDDVMMSDDSSVDQQQPRRKRARVEGLDDEDEEEEEEEENDQDYVESDSGEEGKRTVPRRSVIRGRGRTATGRRSPAAGKNWDRVYEEDDENYESETIRDYPLEVEVFGLDKYFVIDGFVYRKLAAERTRGLGGHYLRCRQDKALNCRARAVVVRTEDGKFWAKLSSTAGHHSHDPPPEGSFLVPVPHHDAGSRKRRGPNRRPETVRRRGRPPRVTTSRAGDGGDDDDDNETDDAATDHPSKYKTAVDFYGNQKYFVMDGYVYRKHRDRRVGLRGVYLRCYQDKDLSCSACAVGVWFRRRSDLDTGSYGERLLFGRLSTRYPNHSHQKPSKGRFWLKPGQQQQAVFVPPHMRKSMTGAPSEGSVECADFTDLATDTTVGEGGGDNIGRDARKSTTLDDHPYDSATNDGRPTNEQFVTTGRSKHQQHSAGQVRGGAVTMQTAQSASKSITATAAIVQAVQSGPYYIIDGYAFKRPNPQQPLLSCVETNREAKCRAKATILPANTAAARSRAAPGTRVQFASAGARKHTHGRPARGQYFIPSTTTATTTTTLPAVVKTSTIPVKGMPASSALLLFTRTPFLRPITVLSNVDAADGKGIRPETRAVNIKSIMNCYRHCMDALIRLQEGYYVDCLPQLSKLVGAPGGELIEYYDQRSDGQLPMLASDERTKFLLNNELKHYRALVDFMLLAPTDCEKLLAAYKQWLTPARSRAWWNSGDFLEYVCRLLLRSNEYSCAYDVALANSQQSTRLRYLFRPLLPLPEPKYLRCERESIRRWEMRQSLETVNFRINSIRLREGDSDMAINRLLDEFEGVINSFRRYLSRHDAERKDNEEEEEEASSASSDEDWAAQLDRKSVKSSRKKSGKKASSRLVDAPPLLTAANASDSERERETPVGIGVTDNSAKKTTTARGNSQRGGLEQKQNRAKAESGSRMRSKKIVSEESESEAYIN